MSAGAVGGTGRGVRRGAAPRRMSRGAPSLEPEAASNMSGALFAQAAVGNCSVRELNPFRQAINQPATSGALTLIGPLAKHYETAAQA
jgi:hypothetical protein